MWEAPILKLSLFFPEFYKLISFLNMCFARRPMTLRGTASSFVADILCLPLTNGLWVRERPAAALLNHPPCYLQRGYHSHGDSIHLGRKTWEGRVGWNLAKAHFSGVKSNRKTSRPAIVCSVWNIISSKKKKKRLSKCLFYDILHISVVFIYSQEYSVLFGWHTAISPFSVSRAMGLPWPAYQQ